jgi:hypothetical protein
VHRLFLDADEDGCSLQALDFLGRLRARFPEDQSNVIEDRRGGENDRRPLMLLEGISYHRCQLYQNLVYVPHRFACMFNCDQAVPDFTMDNILCYPSADMDETLSVLSCCLLAHWLPPWAHV